jgi:hypothetical protein
MIFLGNYITLIARTAYDHNYITAKKSSIKLFYEAADVAIDIQ